jgi:hypothetical protein
VGRTCGTHETGGKRVEGFDGKDRRKEPLGRQRCRWEDGIKLGIREIGWGRMQCIQLAWDRDRWRAVMSAVMNLRVLAPRSYSGVCLLTLY